jgi:sterol 3beta-glucosyltransferase
MAPEGDLKKRAPRKLTKWRKEGHRVTIDMPERFRDGDDVDEDCTAPHGVNAFMNQSVFGMIAAAGSQVDFNARFDTLSSDEEDDCVQPPSQTSDLQANKASKGKTKTTVDEDHRPTPSTKEPIRTIPRSTKSRTRSRSPSISASPAVESPSGPSATEIPGPRLPSSDASVMKRMLEARAELSLRPSFDIPREEEENPADADGGASTSLARRLREIFHFESSELVLSGKFHSHLEVRC